MHLFKAIPSDDDELHEALNELVIRGVDEDDGRSRSELHRLFGHLSEALEEHYGFEAPPGRPSSIEHYEQVWRITHDPAADFHWGTNWVYVLIHKEDLRDGRLDKAVVTGANG